MKTYAKTAQKFPPFLLGICLIFLFSGLSFAEDAPSGEELAALAGAGEPISKEEWGKFLCSLGE